MEATEPAWVGSKTVWVLLGSVILVLAGGVAFVLTREYEERREPPALADAHAPDLGWRPSEGRPIVRPKVTKGADARMSPGEVVIGVEVDGKSRAYRLGALAGYRSHLVNDVVGTVPVSVAYCNLTDCVSVYTGSVGAGPLEVEVAGLLKLEMVLRVNGNLYYQKSQAPLDPAQAVPEMPLRAIAPTRTTWAQWRRGHPESDVYVGDASPSARGAPGGSDQPVSRRAPEG